MKRLLTLGFLSGAAAQAQESGAATQGATASYNLVGSATVSTNEHIHMVTLELEDHYADDNAEFAARKEVKISLVPTAATEVGGHSIPSSVTLQVVDCVTHAEVGGSSSMDSTQPGLAIESFFDLSGITETSTSLQRCFIYKSDYPAYGSIQADLQLRVTDGPFGTGVFSQQLPLQEWKKIACGDLTYTVDTSDNGNYPGITKAEWSNVAGVGSRLRVDYKEKFTWDHSIGEAAAIDQTGDCHPIHAVMATPGSAYDAWKTTGAVAALSPTFAATSDTTFTQTQVTYDGTFTFDVPWYNVQPQYIAPDGCTGNLCSGKLAVSYGTGNTHLYDAASTSAWNNHYRCKDAAFAKRTDFLNSQFDNATSAVRVSDLFTISDATTAPCDLFDDVVAPFNDQNQGKITCVTGPSKRKNDAAVTIAATAAGIPVAIETHWRSSIGDCTVNPVVDQDTSNDLGEETLTLGGEPSVPYYFSPQRSDWGYPTLVEDSSAGLTIDTLQDNPAGYSVVQSILSCTAVSITGGDGTDAAELTAPVPADEDCDSKSFDINSLKSLKTSATGWANKQCTDISATVSRTVTIAQISEWSATTPVASATIGLSHLITESADPQRHQYNADNGFVSTGSNTAVTRHAHAAESKDTALTTIHITFQDDSADTGDTGDKDIEGTHSYGTATHGTVHCASPSPLVATFDPGFPCDSATFDIQHNVYVRHSTLEFASPFAVGENKIDFTIAEAVYNKDVALGEGSHIPDQKITLCNPAIGEDSNVVSHVKSVPTPETQETGTTPQSTYSLVNPAPVVGSSCIEYDLEITGTRGDLAGDVTDDVTILVKYEGYATDVDCKSNTRTPGTTLQLKLAVTYTHEDNKFGGRVIVRDQLANANNPVPIDLQADHVYDYTFDHFSTIPQQFAMHYTIDGSTFTDDLNKARVIQVDLQKDGGDKQILKLGYKSADFARAGGDTCTDVWCYVESGQVEEMFVNLIMQQTQTADTDACASRLAVFPRCHDVFEFKVFGAADAADLAATERTVEYQMNVRATAHQLAIKKSGADFAAFDDTRTEFETDPSFDTNDKKKVTFALGHYAEKPDAMLTSIMRSTSITPGCASVGIEDAAQTSVNIGVAKTTLGEVSGTSVDVTINDACDNYGTFAFTYNDLCYKVRFKCSNRIADAANIQINLEYEATFAADQLKLESSATASKALFGAAVTCGSSGAVTGAQCTEDISSGLALTINTKEAVINKFHTCGDAQQQGNEDDHTWTMDVVRQYDISNIKYCHKTVMSLRVERKGEATGTIAVAANGDVDFDFALTEFRYDATGCPSGQHSIFVQIQGQPKFEGNVVSEGSAAYARTPAAGFDFTMDQSVGLGHKFELSQGCANRCADDERLQFSFTAALENFESANHYATIGVDLTISKLICDAAVDMEGEFDAQVLSKNIPSGSCAEDPAALDAADISGALTGDTVCLQLQITNGLSGWSLDNSVLTDFSFADEQGDLSAPGQMVGNVLQFTIPENWAGKSVTATVVWGFSLGRRLRTTYMLGSGSGSGGHSDASIRVLPAGVQVQDQIEAAAPVEEPVEEAEAEEPETEPAPAPAPSDTSDSGLSMEWIIIIVLGSVVAVGAALWAWLGCREQSVDPAGPADRADGPGGATYKYKKLSRFTSNIDF